MQTLLLERYSYAPLATQGRLYLPSGKKLYTIECPWLNNQPWHSCVPEGYYHCSRHDGTKYTDTWVINVPERTACVFHKANWAHEIHGCVGVGLSASPTGFMVHHSKKAMAVLRSELPEEFNLEIRQYQANFNQS